MKLSACRVALRIARRDALRAKGRSALVVAMIALPILGVTAADVTYRSAHLSAQQAADRQMGAAAAYVSVYDLGRPVEQAPDPDDGTDEPGGDKPTAQQQAVAKEPVGQVLARALPAGARVTPVNASDYLSVSTAYGQTTTRVQGLDLGDPLLHGLVTVLRGRPPAAADQVAATSAFLADTGLKLGGTTTVRGTTRPLTITAVVEFPSDLGSDRLVGRPADIAALAAAAASPGGTPAPMSQPDYLVTLPGGAAFGWADVVRANGFGFTVSSRAVLADPPPRSAVPYFRDRGADGGVPLSATGVTVAATVVGMALLEIVLLAGPAFAVGARRSRRQLGLLAAGGGDRSQIGAVVLGGGVVLGAVGAVLGLVVGAATVAIGRTPLEQRVGARFGSFALQPLDLLGIVCVGLLTGLLAAIVPAVQAARADVVASLTGRGSVKPPSKRLTLLGALAVAAGAAMALLGVGMGDQTAAIMGGSMIAELGVVACTPFLVGLFGKLSRWLPLGPRLALRDSARHRGRTAPAVAAVMAAVAGAVAVVAYQGSSTAEQRAGYSASAPVGSLVMQVSQSSSAADLAQQRAAVQRSVPGLGPRGDFGAVTTPGADCTGDDPCGYASVSLPEDQVCPAYAKGARVWSTDEIKALSRTDPRCRIAYGTGPNYSGYALTAGDATTLRNLAGVTDPAAVRALAEGKVLVRSPQLIGHDGMVTVSVDISPAPDNPNDNGSVKTYRAPGFAVSSDVSSFTGMMTPETARRMGMAVNPTGSVWLPPRMPGKADEQRAQAAAERVDDASITVERGFQSESTAIELGLILTASVVAVAAAGIATGLAAADSQADLATLAAVGAAARIRRTLSGFQCAVIAAMGALLGSAAGLVPAAALWRIHGGGSGSMSYDFGTGVIDVKSGAALLVPWGPMALVVVGLPLLAWLLAAGFTRSRVVLTRRAG
ncbi:FtsX-like permease family protein [Streptacidiphilus cavernicola]|uniref:FtsX-like permease family protein n=1 Tax=Streptacidiphilus cavernicola TaxID=3342716 RepID=A0ABV6VUK0_9ACTN